MASNSPVRATLNCDEFGQYSAEIFVDDIESSSCDTALSEADIACRCAHNYDANAAPQLPRNEKCYGTCTDTKLLTVMLTLTLIFAICEMIFGFSNNSLSLIADSFHMFSDSAALIIAIIAIRLALRPETDSEAHTFGWKRAEVIGALINGVYLASVCAYIILEAIVKLIEPEEMKNPWQIFIVGVVGLAINVVGVGLFFSHRSLALHSGHAHSHGHGHGHSHNGSDGNNSGGSGSANMHGVFLHVAGDAIGSVIVIGTALITIYLPFSWKVYFDPCCSVVFSLIILKSSIPLIMHSSKILMQSAPTNVSIAAIRGEIYKINGVVQIHELHIWQLTASYCVATVHLVLDNSENNQQHNVIKQCNEIFCGSNIHRTTIQTEFI